MPTTKPIHAFTAGTHTTRHGVKVTITEADLNASAAGYNPELHEAPLVIGHPDGAAPAYGWCESFSVDGQDFYAVPRQVNPDFAELHNAGAFKKRSVSFYHPGNPLNPKPGIWYPRHLGFLGAQPPAVKGLKDYAFDEGEGDVLTVEFGEWEDRAQAGLLRSLREWILAKFGKEDADAALPGYALADIEHAAAQPSAPEAAQPSPAFSEAAEKKEGAPMPEPTKPEKSPPEKSPEQIAHEFSERENTLSERERQLAERESAVHKATIADFIEDQVQAGKVLPAQKDNLVEFMAGLEHEQTVDFAEGDATVQKSPLQFMQDYLAAQPKLVAFGEHAAGEEPTIDANDSVALAHAAADFVEAEAAKGRVISVTDAVNHIKKTQGGNT